jgi:hypothetical protein
MKTLQTRMSFNMLVTAAAAALLLPASPQHMTEQRVREKVEEYYGRRGINTLQVLPQAERGETRTGVVVAKDGNDLYLDTTPCSSNKVIIPFYPTYEEEDASSVACGSQSYPRRRVTQR